MRLAPLYDIASSLPYPQQVYPSHATMAMKIGNHYKVLQIGPREWKKAAADLRCQPDGLRARIVELATAIPDAAGEIQRDMKAQGITHGVIQRLVEAMRRRCEDCMATFNA